MGDPHIMVVVGRTCEYEGCDKPATSIAAGRDCKQHPALAVYCDVHASAVANEDKPEYVEFCPNCGCTFGVN